MNFGIYISLPLVAWAFALNAVGYWACRTKVKGWPVPMPVLLAFVSVVLVSLWGCVAMTIDSFKTFIAMELSYALPNAAVIVFLAVFGYDTIHALGKNEKLVEFLNKVLSVFKKEGK